jgi:hypothetical protein
MINPLSINNELLFRHEVLRARLEIRNFFLNNVFREVYENIGQILSLIRVQLADRPSDPGKQRDQRIDAASDLLGKSIRDLREMCRNFYPDTDILKEEGFVEGMRQVVGIIYPHEGSVEIQEQKGDAEPEMKLIVFNMGLEILNAIKKLNGEFINVSVTFTKTEFALTFQYKGRKIPWADPPKMNGSFTDLTIEQRMKLIHGEFKALKKDTGAIQIKLVSPINHTNR